MNETERRLAILETELSRLRGESIAVHMVIEALIAHFPKLEEPLSRIKPLVVSHFEQRAFETGTPTQTALFALERETALEQIEEMIALTRLTRENGNQSDG